MHAKLTLKTMHLKTFKSKGGQKSEGLTHPTNYMRAIGAHLDHAMCANIRPYTITL